MPRDTTPPLALEHARVISYAVVDPDVRWTGRQRLFSGDELLGPAERLAICQALYDDQEYLLCLCDSTWEVQGMTSRGNEAEVAHLAESWYEGISLKWIRTDTTVEQAEEFVHSQDAATSCSFCGKLLVDAELMFVSGLNNAGQHARICSGCINRMHAECEVAAAKSLSSSEDCP